MKVGLLGCGFIGSTIASAIRAKKADLELVSAFDMDAQKCSSLGFKPSSFDEFLASNFDIAVECASQDAVKAYGNRILSKGRSLLVMSVGALSDKMLLSSLLLSARKSGAKLYIPSGAVGGLDALASAKFAGLDEVCLVTRKPPASLGMDVSEETIVFEGTASDAVREFPKNINVAAALALAGLGFEDTTVMLIADPKVSTNIHEVRASGKFGSFCLSFDNLPSENPKTSLLAAFSAIALLDRISGPLQF